MIAGTYVLSGLLLAITGWLFQRACSTTATQTLAWSVIFFVASAAASSAYLTVSEIFPLEIRAIRDRALLRLRHARRRRARARAVRLSGGDGRSHLLARGYLAGAVAMVIGGRWRLHRRRRRGEIAGVDRPPAWKRS